MKTSVQADPSDPQPWYLLGRCFMTQKDYKNAYSAYQQAVCRDEMNPSYWCSIGVLYYQINQVTTPPPGGDRTPSPYRHSLHRAATFCVTTYVKTFNPSQFRDALDAYSRSICLNPAQSEVWYDLGTLYKSCRYVVSCVKLLFSRWYGRQLSDAHDAFSKAAELDPDNPHIVECLNSLKTPVKMDDQPVGGAPVCCVREGQCSVCDGFGHVWCLFFWNRF